MTFSNKIDSILEVGISLHNSNIHNWALAKEQCLGVLEKLEIAGIAIAGGDVMEDVNGQIGFSSASWYCEKNIDEDYNDFVKRSLQKARAYVDNYPHSNNIYFILTPF